MATLGPEVASQIVAVCKTNAGEVAGALKRTFGGKFEVPADDIQIENLAAGDADFNGPGLACLFLINDTAALAFLPQSSGMLPDWYGAPDASSANKLFSMALELGMMLLPDEFVPIDNKIERVDRFQESLEYGAVPADAGVISLSVKAEDKAAKMWLVWPVGKPDKVFVAKDNKPPVETNEAHALEMSQESAAHASTAGPTSLGAPPSPPRVAYESLEDGLRLLPAFTRSLLKIKIPVVVTLASRTQSVREVLDIVPGSILQFDKSCEEPLTVEVSNQAIALGEAVKVDEMFGLRITSIVMPDERFLAIQGKRVASNK